MADLKKVFEGLGFTKVSTLLQSGNVVFDSSLTHMGKITKLISDTITNSFGLKIKLLVLPREEFVVLLKNNPFMKSNDASVYVTILFDKPQEIFIDYLNKFKSAGEEFFISGRAVYLLCPKGYGKTKLSNNFFESKLNVSATTRNLATMKKIAELL